MNKNKLFKFAMAMPTVSYATAGTATNIIGIVNQHEADINTKVLQNLQHNSLGIWNSATPENPSTVANAGTYIFKVVKIVQFKAYTAATRNDAPDTPKLEIKIKADVDHAEVARTEIEQLDSAIIADAEAFTSFIARSHGNSMTALLDAHYIDLAVATAKADKAKREIINADFLDLDTADKRIEAYRQVARAQVAITRQLNTYDLGTNPTDYGTFLHMNVINDFILETAKGGAISTETVRELATRLGAYALGGLGVVKDHVFLGQTIAKGLFSKDTDFDFSEIAGITAHKEALFIAINGLTTRATVDTKSGNDVLITKFNLYKKAIRPELVMAFRTKASA